jgi:hypothetical protein
LSWFCPKRVYCRYNFVIGESLPQAPSVSLRNLVRATPPWLFNETLSYVGDWSTYVWSCAWHKFFWPWPTFEVMVTQLALKYIFDIPGLNFAPRYSIGAVAGREYRWRRSSYPRIRFGRIQKSSYSSSSSPVFLKLIHVKTG